MHTGPMVRLFTAAGVHAADVAGSAMSVRHAHSQAELLSVTVEDATVDAPDLSCTAAVRVPASDFCISARVVTAITWDGVEAIEAMP